MQSQRIKQTDEYTDLNKVLEWFILLRWIACAGVCLTLAFVKIFFNYELPYDALIILTAALFTVNLGFSLYFYVVKKKLLSPREMKVLFNVQVCCDYILLFLLVHFTGYLENPFLFYFVFHTMLTSFIFPRRVVVFYISALILVFIATALCEYYRVIPHYTFMTGHDTSYYELIPIRTFGIITTLIIASYLLTSIKSRLEKRGKMIEVELNRYKSLEKIKSNFILQVTHELRGPIAAQKGFIEMVLKRITGDITARTEETLKKARRRTDNLLTIIDEMLDYAYMKSEEELKYEKQPLKIREVIDYNMELYSARARERSLELRADCPQDLVWTSNRDILNIILGNLLTNAIKYSYEGRPVLVSAGTEDGRLHISVADEGIGMSPDEMEKIFDEFYRTMAARKIEKDGTGLGLAIIKRAVDSLGGQISVYSEKDRGSRFHIYLPE